MSTINIIFDIVITLLIFYVIFVQSKIIKGYKEYLSIINMDQIRKRIDLLEELSEKAKNKKIKQMADELESIKNRYKKELENRVKENIKLNKDIEALKTSLDIVERYQSGDDYRYEILKEMKKKGRNNKLKYGGKW